MRIAWVMGRVTLNDRLDEMRPGRYLICEALDADALADTTQPTLRRNPMPESLVVFDQLGAGEGDLIAFTEGREAANPFNPDNVPLDAYCAAILDRVDAD